MEAKMRNKTFSVFGLTLSCQSGVSALATAAALQLLGAPVVAAGPVDWAHANGALQRNGQVQVRTLSGAAVSSMQNPDGALAKANQTTATQGPSITIQATGASYAETIPLLVTGLTAPSCPSGYTAVWSKVFMGNTYSYVFNIGGTRWSFGSFNASSTGTVWMWIYDTTASSFYNGNGILTSNDNAFFRSFGMNVGATLCSK